MRKIVSKEKGGKEKEKVERRGGEQGRKERKE